MSGWQKQARATTASRAWVAACLCVSILMSGPAAAQIVANPDGTFSAVAVDAPQTTCPAFAGPQLSALVVTSARINLDAEALRGAPNSGATFVFEGVAKGQSEHQVII